MLVVVFSRGSRETNCWLQQILNIATFLKSGCNCITEPLSATIVEEEKSHAKETETLVAPTQYAVVATDEENSSLRGDHSSQLPSEDAHFHVAAVKVDQPRSVRLLPTQETGYCTETATQGEITYLSHDGKQQTYHRVPSQTHLSVRHSGDKETLTATVGEMAIEEGGTKDKAVSEDDTTTTSVPLARGGTERNIVSARKQRAETLSPQHSQTLTPQSNRSNSNSSLFFYTDCNVAAPLGSLTADTQHKDGDTAPGDPSSPSRDKQSVAASQCGRAVDRAVSPVTPAGPTNQVHGPTQNHKLAQVRGDRDVSPDPDLHLVMSVEATGDVGMSHPTDLVVAVVQLPKLMVKSMTVNVQTPR